MSDIDFSKARILEPGSVKSRKQAAIRPSSKRRRSADYAIDGPALKDIPFVAWDGEAVNQYVSSPTLGTKRQPLYCVLGSSIAPPLVGRYLDTETMLDHLLDVSAEAGRANHISFAFNYDVNNILKDLEWPKLVSLMALGECRWNGYQLKHIPGKSFSVCKDRKRIRIDDIFSYFRLPYIKALEQYKVGSDEIRDSIRAGKEGRDRFTWSDLDNIVAYFQLELETMPELMEHIRTACFSAGMYIKSWYGPGALAKYRLADKGMLEYKSEKRTQAKGKRHAIAIVDSIPDDVRDAARHAYAGGWFERYRVGYYDGPCYTADLNSAYAAAMVQLPSLANSEWEYVSGNACRARTAEFGLFHLKYGGDARAQFNNFYHASIGLPLPLFQRTSKGNMSRPFATEGWYWNYEARPLRNDRDKTEFIEGWILKDSGERPFEWIEGDYNTRLILKAAGDPAQLALKWALASMYGTLAQRSGWDRHARTSPIWHQLEWAGLITSWCRSRILAAACPVAMKHGLVSIDTDGILSTQPFDHLSNSKELGGWELSEYSGCIYLQNGVYWLRDMSGNWIAPKTRGIPQGQIQDHEIGLDALRTGTLNLSRRNFVGYGSALHRRDRDTWRTWEDSPVGFDVHRSGPRQHTPMLCRLCRSLGDSHTRTRDIDLSTGLHDVALVPTWEKVSQSHKLPWLEADDTAQLQARIRHEWEQHVINMEWN